MKRTNVVLDEELLERARRVTGERTYSATITKALQEMVRVHELNRALDRFEASAAKGDFFNRDYVEEHWPDVAGKVYPQRASANERRLTSKGPSKRGARR